MNGRVFGKVLIAKGVKIDAVDSDRQAALHLAAANGRTGAVKVLASAGASIDAGNANGWTALHIAAAIGNVELIRVRPLNALQAKCVTIRRLQILVEAGANVNASNFRKQTALHIAVDEGQMESAEVFPKCSGNGERAIVSLFEGAYSARNPYRRHRQKAVHSTASCHQKKTVRDHHGTINGCAGMQSGRHCS